MKESKKKQRNQIAGRNPPTPCALFGFFFSVSFLLFFLSFVYVQSSVSQIARPQPPHGAAPIPAAPPPAPAAVPSPVPSPNVTYAFLKSGRLYRMMARAPKMRFRRPVYNMYMVVRGRGKCKSKSVD